MLRRVLRLPAAFLGCVCCGLELQTVLRLINFPADCRSFCRRLRLSWQIWPAAASPLGCAALRWRQPSCSSGGYAWQKRTGEPLRRQTRSPWQRRSVMSSRSWASFSAVRQTSGTPLLVLLLIKICMYRFSSSPISNVWGAECMVLDGCRRPYTMAVGGDARQWLAVQLHRQCSEPAADATPSEQMPALLRHVAAWQVLEFCTDMPAC